MDQSGGQPIRWGIIGTGGIAADFVRDLARLPDAVVQAVGSRSQTAADGFGERFGIADRHATYAALAQNPIVDVVYVATPHPGHHAAAMLAIEAGKAVLVEKPFTMNAAEARELVDAAQAAGVFLMEAMWTRFLPHMARIRGLLDAGALGTIRSVTADHGQWFDYDASHRLFAPELGGGALLDLGVYPVSFSSWVLGTPESITAVSNRTETGVDAQTSMVLRYADQQHAVLHTTLEALTPNRAAICGTEARIEIDATWYTPTSFSLIGRDESVQRFVEPFVGHGLAYQAEEVGRCLRANLRESPLMPLAETVAIMETLDEVRRQIKLVYPSKLCA